MTGFYVDPAGMDGLYNQLYRAHIDAGAAEIHVKAHADMPFYSEGLIFILLAPHERAYSLIHGGLERSSALASSLRTGVNQAQVRYAQVDARSAEELDVAYPAPAWPVGVDAVVANVHPDLAVNHGAFLDAREPQMHLGWPSWAADSVIFSIDPITDLLSPSAWIRQACQSLMGFDPFQPWLQAIGGNWSAYYTCSVTWGQVGGAVSDIGRNLIRTAQDTPLVWRGNAAGALQQFLLSFADVLGQLADACGFYAGRYREGAEAAKNLFEAISGPVGELLDVIIFAAAAAALGTATVETVIGGVIGYTVAAFYIARALELYDEIATFYDRAKAAMAGLAGAMDLYHSRQTWTVPELNAYAAPTIR